MALKSNFPNMVLTLLIVTLVSGAVLGVVNHATKGPINLAKEKAKNDAIKAILPAYDSLGETYRVMPTDGTDSLVFYPALDASGNLVGTAVQSYTINGFSGYIGIMVGFDPTGTVTGFQVLEHKETPGLGAKMQIWFSNQLHTIIGKNPSTTNMTVSKDGGDIDAITASTITSRAFLEAVVRAYNNYKPDAAVDAASGATKQVMEGRAE